MAAIVIVAELATLALFVIFWPALASDGIR